MRVVYVDEAGRGHAQEEPHFVVACAITHPDVQWHQLRKHYVDLANDVFGLSGDDAHEEYVFHAKDIWHGHGDFPRERFSLQERMNILVRLSQVPGLYNIPVCVAIVDRKRFAEQGRDRKSTRVLEHAYGYALALQYVDSWMDANCRDEVAMITAEDVGEVKEAVRLFHEGAKKTDDLDEFFDRGAFVTKSVIDSVNFAEKAHSPLLQIADHCAFLAKRTSVGCEHAAKIWGNIRPQVWTKNKHAGANLRLKVPIDQLGPVV